MRFVGTGDSDNFLFFEPHYRGTCILHSCSSCVASMGVLSFNPGSSFAQTAFLCPFLPTYDLFDLNNLRKNIRIVSIACIYWQFIYSGHRWSLNSSSIAKAHIVMNATSTLKQKEVSAKSVKHEMTWLKIVFSFTWCRCWGSMCCSPSPFETFEPPAHKKGNFAWSSTCVPRHLCI